MHGRLWQRAAASALAGAVLLASAPAALAGALPGASPKACVVPLPSELQGAAELSATDSGVHAQSSSFRYEKHPYPFETYSAVAHPSPSYAYWCFRYEIENIGQQAILDLSWDRLFDRGDRQDLAPGERAVGGVQDWSLDPPELRTTTLYAFEDTQANSVVYVQDDTRNPPPNTLSPAAYDLPRQSPDFWAFASSRAHAAASVLAFRSFTAPITLPDVSRDYSLAGLRISSDSQLFFDGKYYTTKYSVQVSSKAGNAVIVAPALLTMREYTSNWKEFTSRYLRDLKLAPAIKSSSYKGEMSFPSLKSVGYSVFVVRYPVAVRVGKAEVCLSMPMYSPNPLSPGGRNCDALTR